MDSKKQSTFSSLLRSKLVIILELVILVGLSVALGKEVFLKYRVQGDIRELETEISELEYRNVELGSLINYFESDEYKEEQARLKLGLQKPGESVITVLGASTESEIIQTETLAYNTNTLDDKKTNPHRWWDYFFNVESMKNSD